MSKRMNEDEQSIYKATQRILSSSTKQLHLNAVLFLVDRKAYKALVALQEQLQELFVDNRKYVKSLAFVNVLNTKVAKRRAAQARPAVRFNISQKIKYSLIADPQKSVKELDSQFGKWKNKQTFDLKRVLKSDETPLSVHMKERLIKELENSISVAESSLEELKANFKEYDVKITNIAQQHAYSQIQFYSDGKSYTEHLSAKVANVLWFEDVEAKRADEIITEFVKRAENPFGDVYFIKI